MGCRLPLAVRMALLGYIKIWLPVRIALLGCKDYLAAVALYSGAALEIWLRRTVIRGCNLVVAAGFAQSQWVAGLMWLPVSHEFLGLQLRFGCGNA